MFFEIIKAEQCMTPPKVGNVGCFDASSCSYVLVLYDKIIIVLIFPPVEISVTWIYALFEKGNCSVILKQ